MLFIQHNLLAQNANRQLNINTNKNTKITEKLSSGYKINRAADDAAGLAISEKMRRQIRGLMQGTANAKDGISYVQVADGAMNEGHDIMQRMNELAIKSLNGTLTESDRAALNAEFDQLRTEIDRINTDTEFNEQRIFEDHEPSYYQIEGCKRWNDNQLHTVSAPENDLIINLPDSYVPNQYTLTVPTGIYTTQELVDEIDDALENMTPPNPGFVFEYTDKGYCNLNFESASGMPTEIASVEGSLSYLLYDLYSSSSTGDLLGNRPFINPLPVYAGCNDELGFYIQSARGAKYISMRIPEGLYTREDMIQQINSELAKYPEAAGVTAKEYEGSYIQITGGKGVNITGMKGNMFKYESTHPIYESVFYDNVQYGVSSSNNASITGQAYYNSTVTDSIHIKTGVNDTLRFKLNEESDYIKVDIPAGEYTIVSLKDALQAKFKALGIDKEISAGYSYTSDPRKDYLVLSSNMNGSKSLLEFDTTAGSVYANTYDTLFKITNYLPVKIEKENAYIIGDANLSNGVILSNGDSLTFNVNDTTCTISGIGNNYTSLDALVSALNSKLNKYINDNSNNDDIAALKDNIKFEVSGNNLAISALSDSISKIYFVEANQNNTYKTLFTREEVRANMGSVSKNPGSIQSMGNESGIVQETPAKIAVTIPEGKRKGSITIDDNSCTMSFSASPNDGGSITLEAKTYANIQALVDEMNDKLMHSDNKQLRNIIASYNSSTGEVIFSSSPSSLGALSNTIELSGTGTSSVWKNIFGTTTITIDPTVNEACKSSLTTYTAIAENTEINSTNNTLVLNIGGGDVTINIDSGSYTSRATLLAAVQKAIDNNSALTKKIAVGITGDNQLQFSTDSAILDVSGSFYDKVLIRDEKKDPTHKKNGSYLGFKEVFIIGRKDLTGDPVEIVSDLNDVFTFDFTYNSTSSLKNSYKVQMDVAIPEGTYTGSQIASVLQDQIQQKFDKEGLDEFEIEVTIGGHKTDVTNFDENTALQISVKRKGNAEPDSGGYILDGVRGSAANVIFYKTTTEMKVSYITGTKDISKGVIFQPGKNVLTLSADSIPYQYTFPENTYYTADEFVNLLNGMFVNGDDNGNEAPLSASIENGVLKISLKLAGSHRIGDVGGSARSTVFYEESGRDSRNKLTILVSGEAGDNIEIPRTSVGSCSLRINSITISKPKYAEKAVRRIKEAIDLLSSRRSTYGALQNRLEHTVNNNNNIIENTQASESAIRDTDIADAMMEYSINNILMQAGVSMLTQANQSSQLMLSLLQ